MEQNWNKLEQIGDGMEQFGDAFLMTFIKFLLVFNHSIKFIGHQNDSIDVVLVLMHPSDSDIVAPMKPNFRLLIW